MKEIEPKLVGKTVAKVEGEGRAFGIDSIRITFTDGSQLRVDGDSIDVNVEA